MKSAEPRQAPRTLFCEYDGEAAPGDVNAPGSEANVGRFLAADLEGLSIIDGDARQTWLLASSQGDSSFHFYLVRGNRPEHLGAFLIDGVGETDGVHYASTPVGPNFRYGLLVVQNGDAPPPADEGDVNGYEVNGATQLKYIDFLDTLRALAR